MQTQQTYRSEKVRKAKKLNQYSKYGEFIKTWDCVADMNRELGIDNGSITRCCKGKQKTAGGFIWQYKN